ncbi:MAG: hypothetical protein DRG78_01330 [Epsilonproteobacteria bacterium]|nr:MAG: hypothetical protein DRG78_01330 [Campylobacterota bacterium]
MKKLILLFILICNLLASNINFIDVKSKSSINFTNSEQQYLKNKKQITMCVDPDWMPFEKVENGKHIGLASDYIKIIEKSIDIPITLIQTKNWNESIQKAKNRECDIFSMVPMIEERKKYMDFTSSYLDIPMVIATKTDKHFIDNIEYILDKKIGIVKSYSISNILKKQYPNINIVDVESISDGLMQVESGKIFAFIDNLATINYMINKNFLGILKVSGRLGNRLQYRVATRNDEPILNTIFDKIIKNIDVATNEKIFTKWVNSPNKETIVDYALIWQILIVVFLVILIFIYRQYILNKVNHKLHILVDEKTKDLEDINKNLEMLVEEKTKKLIENEKLFAQQSKLVAMGEMIGNIAHQWRQPLSIISTASTGIIMHKKYDLLEEDKLIETCTSINENAQYLSKTIDDFSNFIKGDREKTIFSLKDGINSFLSLVKGTIKSNNISVVLDLQENIKIDGYENELMQCFINIFNNAKDILVEKVEDNRLIFISTFINKDKVIIKIKDNGGGIPEDIINKVFEPYFTTKHQSQGTGLGLHMTYNIIVDGMKGTVEVNNIEYKHDLVKYRGAEFFIVLSLN